MYGMPAMNELTPPQRKIFDFISQQVEEVGVPPTVREIARRFDVAIGTVQGHLKALDRKGVVRRMRDRARGLALAVKRDWTGSLRLPVLGRVPAGLPVEAVALADEHFPVPGEIAQGANFILRAKGDSMVPKIEDGDLLLVRLQEEAVEGDIVIAYVGDEGEATVKRFRRQGKRVFLQADNAKYAPILKPFKVAGRVTGLIRTGLR